MAKPTVTIESNITKLWENRERVIQVVGDILEHLAQMIEILGPVPKAFTKRYREWFTKRGYLRACRVGFQKGITRLLKDEDIGNREAAEWSSIISPLLSYAYRLQHPLQSSKVLSIISQIQTRAKDQNLLDP